MPQSSREAKIEELRKKLIEEYQEFCGVNGLCTSCLRNVEDTINKMEEAMDFQHQETLKQVREKEQKVLYELCVIAGKRDVNDRQFHVVLNEYERINNVSALDALTGGEEKLLN